jgi:hypothetical protein
MGIHGAIPQLNLRYGFIHQLMIKPSLPPDAPPVNYSSTDEYMPDAPALGKWTVSQGMLLGFLLT